MRPRICVISISHKSAPLEVRERMCVTDDDSSSMMRHVADQCGEAVLVRTCGRKELYITSSNVARASALFAEGFRVSPALVRSFARVMNGRRAATHLLQVASGLQSPLPGEHHVLGQVRSALLTAQSVQSVGPHLSALFRTAIRCGRRVRTETPIGRLSQTYASAALAALGNQLPSTSRVLIVGSGTLAEELAQGVAAYGIREIIVASRHERRGRDLASDIRGVWRPIEGVSELAHHADVIVCCTSSRKTLVHSCDGLADGRPRRYLDLGMPRNIDARVAWLPGAQLTNLDDLSACASITDACVRHADAIIDEELQRFIAWSDRRRTFYASRPAASATTSRVDVRPEEAA